jgi:hypothetical protein
MKQPKLPTFKFLFALVFAAILAVATIPGPVSADENTSEDANSHFTSHAQVQRAENLAKINAENTLARKDYPTDEAYGEALANATDTTVDEIRDMREKGMGWGQIAHELGIHPGALGLGHYKDKTEEMKGITSRSMKNDFSRGHGAKSDGKGPGHGSSSGHPGKGLGKGKSGKASGKK